MTQKELKWFEKDSQSSKRRSAQSFGSEKRYFKLRSCLVFLARCYTPSVETKILEEKKAKLILHKEKEDEERRLLFSAKQVYLHAAFCETLRLYPPVPYRYKFTTDADTLSNGHGINKN
ncbi:hypothetical protein CUMW_266620 [Citrus unshiu]|uniref:Uncharacterized protein n=1 Tax=Citrus unshiu TaxID=55188 RepID=A0A2H5QVU9_CITUN|nr:hypothetical protein CUMW_266620 [Citrus unshiu]